MGAVTIRNIDAAVKYHARLAAAANGRSLEAELRALLERTYLPASDERARRIQAMSGQAFVRHLIRTANGSELAVPERGIDPERDVFGAD